MENFVQKLDRIAFNNFKIKVISFSFKKNFILQFLLTDFFWRSNNISDFFWFQYKRHKHKQMPTPPRSESYQGRPVVNQIAVLCWVHCAHFCLWTSLKSLTEISAQGHGLKSPLLLLVYVPAVFKLDIPAP